MKDKPLACSICGKELNLNDCKTDERGMPVHGECYATRLTEKTSESRPPEVTPVA